MMILLALLAATSSAERTDVESCSPGALKMIETMDAIGVGLPRAAGLSAAGQEVVAAMLRDNAIAVWCGESRPESGLAHERLLSVMAAEKIDEEALATARRAELAAIMKDEAAELDALITTMRDLSSEDRRKFANWLANDLRHAWRKREAAAEAN